MSLYLVVYMLGSVAMVEGPLPDGVRLENCAIAANNNRLSAIDAFDENPNVFKLNGKTVSIDDMEFSCEFSEARPN